MHMRVDIEPGRYVVAVSGGVDSVALLDILSKTPGLKLTVAHFDHGIRGDSSLDRELVQKLARQYGLPFVYHQGNLGAGTSEEAARLARYAFLRQVQRASQAQAIITAHHQDDVLETAIINMLRGTGRRGMSSLQSHRHLVRPLLTVPKSDLQAYAKDQGLVWREDSTNQDLTLLRNYIRRVLLPKMGREAKHTLLTHVSHMSVLNRAIDKDLLVYLHIQPSRQSLDRHQFILLPHAVALEVMAQWLRSHHISFDKKLLEQLVSKAKTLAPGKQIAIDRSHHLRMGRETIVLIVN
ncbi:tRNA lysidine(34) synthetase TilS [Candidatus Saccharibacteria bacterium]|nr:MAG: tRNA lysidine(34) synthetase TilS [Candidatus Saccharibacteria bacterium]